MFSYCSAAAVPPSEDVRPIEEYDEPWEWSRKKRSLVVSVHESSSKVTTGTKTDDDIQQFETTVIPKRESETGLSPTEDARPEDEYDVPWEWQLKQRSVKCGSFINNQRDKSPISENICVVNTSIPITGSLTPGEATDNRPLDEYDVPWEWRLKQQGLISEIENTCKAIEEKSCTFSSNRIEKTQVDENELSPTCIKEFDKLLDEYDVPMDWRIKMSDMSNEINSAVSENSTRTPEEKEDGTSKEKQEIVNLKADERPLDEYDVPWEWQAKQRSFIEAQSNFKLQNSKSTKSSRVSESRESLVSKRESAVIPPSVEEDQRPEGEYDIPWELLRKQHRSTLPSAERQSDYNNIPSNESNNTSQKYTSSTELLFSDESKETDVELHITEESDRAGTLSASSSNSMVSETLRLLTEMDIKTSEKETAGTAEKKHEKTSRKVPPKKPPRKDKMGECSTSHAAEGISKENSLERNVKNGTISETLFSKKEKPQSCTDDDEQKAHFLNLQSVSANASDEAGHEAQRIASSASHLQSPSYDTRPLDDYDAPWEWIAKKNSHHSIRGA